jgi:hypothetical protein
MSRAEELLERIAGSLEKMASDPETRKGGNGH